MFLFFSCQPQSVIMNKQLLESQDASIAYEISGKGKTIVFIHAGGLDNKMWKT